MEIPKKITRKTKYKTGEIREHTYKFIKKCNDDLFLYEEVNQHYKECFTKFDLGIKTRQMKVTHVNPEKVKIRKEDR